MPALNRGFSAKFPRLREAHRARFALLYGGRQESKYILAPTGYGKTTFLTNDLSAALASEKNVIAISVPLKRARDDAAGVLTDGIIEAIDEMANSLKGRLRAIAKTEIQEISTPALGSIKFGEEPGAVAQTSSTGALHNALRLLLRRAPKGTAIVLLIDDADFLLRKENHAAANALAAELENNPQLRALFAIDSSVAAESLFDRPNAPMAGIASRTPLSLLGDEFFVFMAKAYEQEVGVPVNMQELEVAYRKLGGNPRALGRLLESMAYDRASSPWEYFMEIYDQLNSSQDWSQYHFALSPTQRVVLERLAAGEDPYSEDSMRYIAGAVRKSEISSTVVQECLDGLRKDLVIDINQYGWYISGAGYNNWLCHRMAVSHEPVPPPSVSRIAQASLSAP